MIKLAIIGTGRMGTYHTNVALANQNTNVAALVNPSPLNPALRDKAPHAQYAQNHTDILDTIDAAVIAAPTPAHFSIARDLLAAGKHVLIEKPITLSYQEAQELFSLAEQNNCVLHVGHVERYNPAFLAAQKHMIGTPQVIRATRSGPYHPRVGHDSVVLDLMIHDIDLVMKLLTTPPTLLAASGTSHVSSKPDSCIALLTAGTMFATITAHRGAASATREMVIETPTQTLLVNFGTRTLTIKSGQEITVVEPPAAANPLATQLAAFVDAIKSGSNRRNELHDLGVLAQTLAVEAQLEAVHATLAKQEVILVG